MLFHHFGNCMLWFITEPCRTRFLEQDANVRKHRDALERKLHQMQLGLWISLGKISGLNSLEVWRKHCAYLLVAAYLWLARCLYGFMWIADLFLNTWQRQTSKDMVFLNKKRWRDSPEVNDAEQGWRIPWGSSKAPLLLGSEAVVAAFEASYKVLAEKQETGLLLTSKRNLKCRMCQSLEWEIFLS